MPSQVTHLSIFWSGAPVGGKTLCVPSKGSKTTAGEIKIVAWYCPPTISCLLLLWIQRENWSQKVSFQYCRCLQGSSCDVLRELQHPTEDSTTCGSSAVLCALDTSCSGCRSVIVSAWRVGKRAKKVPTASGRPALKKYKQWFASHKRWKVDKPMCWRTVS